MNHGLDISRYTRYEIGQDSAKASDKADAIVKHNDSLAEALSGVRGGAELRKKIARAQRLSAQLAKVQDEIFEALKEVY